jgi:hypothetical protein
LSSSRESERSVDIGLRIAWPTTGRTRCRCRNLRWETKAIATSWYGPACLMHRAPSAGCVSAPSPTLPLITQSHPTPFPLRTRKLADREPKVPTLNTRQEDMRPAHARFFSAPGRTRTSVFSLGNRCAFPEGSGGPWESDKLGEPALSEPPSVETGCITVANRRLDVQFQPRGMKRAATDVAASSCMVGRTCE